MSILVPIDDVLNGLREWGPTEIVVAGIRGDGKVYVAGSHGANSAEDLLEDAIFEIQNDCPNFDEDD